jgi:hypothetical protein
MSVACDVCCLVEISATSRALVQRSLKSVICCTQPSNETTSQRISGGWKRQARYAISLLQKTASFIEVKPHNVHHITHTYIMQTARIPLKASRE